MGIQGGGGGCSKIVYDTVRREVLCNISIESYIPMKLARLKKMCLNAIYSKVWTGKHLSDTLKLCTNKSIIL